MTEEDAKKKWCPMVRVGDNQGSSADNRVADNGYVDAEVNQPGRGVRWMCCMASECMMWVWDDEAEEEEVLPEGEKPEGEGWVKGEKAQRRYSESFVYAWKRKYPARNGHCGLIKSD